MQILYEVFQKTKGERKLPNNHGYLVGGQTPQSCQLGCRQSSVLSPRSEIQTTLLMELTPNLKQSRLQAQGLLFLCNHHQLGFEKLGLYRAYMG